MVTSVHHAADASNARIMPNLSLQAPMAPRSLLRVDRRLRVEQQRHQIAQLCHIEDLLVAEARHVRAGHGRLRVPQPVMLITGTLPLNAAAVAVTMLVMPGPSVTVTTEGLLAAREKP